MTLTNTKLYFWILEVEQKPPTDSTITEQWIRTITPLTETKEEALELLHFGVRHKYRNAKLFSIEALEEEYVLDVVKGEFHE